MRGRLDGCELADAGSDGGILQHSRARHVRRNLLQQFNERSPEVP
jgi:hypothetical protein